MRWDFQWRENIPLALPVIVGQIGHIAASVADSMMVGALGTIPLAAVSLASSIASVPLVFGIGMAYGLTPMVAHAMGQARPFKAVRLLKNGTVVNAFTSAFMFLFALVLFWGIQFTGQEPAVVEEARTYLWIIMASYLPFMLFMSAKQYLEGMGDTKTPMRISLYGNVGNIGLNALLIYGWGPFPEWGIVGAGVATIIARGYMMMAAWWFVLRRGKADPADWLRAKVTSYPIRALLKIGIPSGFQYIFEVSAFAASAWIIGTLGATPLAAHQVAISLASISYMAATGLGAAATIRIGQAMGRKDLAGAKAAGTSLFLITIIFMALTGLTFFVFRHQLPWAYTQDPAVVASAAALLVVATIFQISDGVQATALGALRGIQDVRVPTAITFVAYYVIALPLEWYFGHILGWGAVGVWSALAVGLTVSAMWLSLRFYRGMERRRVA
ncbi:MAG: MATE family efflux transporter [Flavobacteriia bacterium]|nr:MATE family efflux transporter [Flavobacteriia bacterium]NDA06570.1 MATE family efflux transporter [Flavobacteriia bacterium]NDA28485.1 MATE family efflux transporter [Flavobacteriia bacterium]NDD18962.1 MATE family efflux transporter [Flavobacteriia bacterium]NDD79653.1 MATE family efflux transporter [Flavobacteriia bacterium]